MELKLTNSLGRKKETFTPQEDKKVKMYVCGVTPYDYSHVGHGRCYVSFDILFRTLKLLGYKVTYVRNITDIDDKLINAAEKEGNINNYKQIAEKFTAAFHEDMKKLNNLSPNIEPKATEHIEQMIKFIQGLIEKKLAYVVNNDVYFDVSAFKNYGKLSGKKLENLQAGARIQIDERKKNPADFALWKGNDNKQFWKSPWGYGRPGWHIECSVMAKEYLGETIDIHGGGMDLIFPHHENEVAQSEGLHNKPFAKYWIHNAFININKEKMSKSLGNFFTLRQIFEKFDPMILRFYFLQHQYKTPIEFSFDELEASKTAYKKLISAFENINVQTKTLEQYLKYDITKEMIEALGDDINTPKLLGVLFENLNEIKKSDKLLNITKSFLNQILGLTLQPIKYGVVEITPEIQELIDQREQARKDKDWTTADKIRDQLIEMGVEIQDKKL